MAHFGAFLIFYALFFTSKYFTQHTTVLQYCNLSIHMQVVYIISIEIKAIFAID